MLKVQHCNLRSIKELLTKYNLKLKVVSDESTIPGSYWGDSEAGLISNNLYVRNDTPIHSLLHESCHYICMDTERRITLNTNAEGDYEEENGVCYMQILLSDNIPEMGKERMFVDMDDWGYTFRLGSAKAWFYKDAEDAVTWLTSYNLLNKKNMPSYKLRIS